MQIPEVLGIIAGNGVYPQLVAAAARKAGVKKIVAAGFTDETDPLLRQYVDVLEWMRVGQLGRLLKFFRAQHIHHAIMAGQIAPKNLFDLRPDMKAMMLLAKLKQRNAESIFAAIANELATLEAERAGKGLAMDIWRGTADDLRRFRDRVESVGATWLIWVAAGPADRSELVAATLRT